jgi:radical SAM superfamily enzyme YgiQ (UPF0313 family)
MINGLSPLTLPEKSFSGHGICFAVGYVLNKEVFVYAKCMNGSRMAFVCPFAVKNIGRLKEYHKVDTTPVRNAGIRCAGGQPSCRVKSLSQAERLSNMSSFRAAEQVLFDRISGANSRGQNFHVEVVYAYPNEYSVGICSLGYQVVWAALSGIANVSVARLFTDAMESLPQHPDLLGFSLSWELDYKGLFAQLAFVGVPRRATERTDSDPLVFGGGPVLTANPEPFADFFDVILLGDGEDVLPAFIERYREERGRSRRDVLAALAGVPGVYIPCLYEVRYAGEIGPIESISPIQAGIPETVQKATYRGPALATSTVVSPLMAWENIFMVEAVRSCPEMCTFCLASYVTLPFRSAPVEEHLLPAIDRGLEVTNRIGILGASVTQHPQFQVLLAALQKEQYADVRLSLSSVRANTVTEDLARTLVSRGSKSITIAVESGSERLRKIINKKLENSEIIEAGLRGQAGGLSSMKLYGMAGIPGEITSDHEETLRMFQTLRKEIRTSESKTRGIGGMRLTFGCSTFVPKAHTPFQWFGVRKDAEKTIQKLDKQLSKIGVDFRPESHKWSCVQALISRGDRRVSKVLETVTGYGDSLGSFRRAFKDLKRELPPLEYYVYEDWPIDAVLPWNHLRTSISPSTILKRRTTSEEQFPAT